MTYHLVLERSHHGPRFLGSFQSREEADANRARLIVDFPDWGRLVRLICTKTRSDHSSNGRN